MVTSLQGSSIPSTSCREALRKGTAQTPSCSRPIALLLKANIPQNLEPRVTQLWHVVLCKGSWFRSSRGRQPHHPSSHLLSTASSQAQVLRAGPSLPDTGINCKKTAFGKAGPPATSSPFLEKTEFRVRIAAVFNREKLSNKPTSACQFWPILVPKEVGSPASVA